MIYVFIFLLVVFQILWLLWRFYMTPGTSLMTAFEDDLKQLTAHLGVVATAVVAVISSAWDHIGPLLVQTELTTALRDWLAANVSASSASLFASFVVLAAAIWRARR